MRRLAILLLLLPTLAFPAESADEARADEAAQYQVDLVIFANLQFDEQDEHWGKVAPFYPGDMLWIDPLLPNGLQPTTQWQLEEQQAYEEIAAADAPLPEPPDAEARDAATPDTAAPVTDTPLPSAAGLRNDPMATAASAAMAEAEARELLEELLAADPDPPFAMRDPVQSKLAQVLTRLQRSRNYRVLYTGTWRQPIGAAEETHPLLIQGGARYDDLYEIDGTITLSRSRYLHLDTRLWFTTFARVSALPGTTSDTAPLAHEVPEALRTAYPALYQFETDRHSYLPLTTYEMQQSRRMRSGRLHYVDHPAFGLLIEITPVEQDASASGE